MVSPIALFLGNLIPQNLQTRGSFLRFSSLISKIGRAGCTSSTGVIFGISSLISKTGGIVCTSSVFNGGTSVFDSTSFFFLG